MATLHTLSHVTVRRAQPYPRDPWEDERELVAGLS